MYSLKSTMSISMLIFLILQVAKLSSALNIETKAAVYEVAEGSKVIMDCLIKGNPEEDKTLWTKINKNGQKDVIYAGTFKVSKDPHFGKRFENNSIEIVNANKDDEGNYECQLLLGSGEIIIHQLVIQYKPVMLDSNPQNIEVQENNNVTVLCNADGVPKPTYTWERKGKMPPSFNKEGAENTFRADPDLSGSYFCTASNILGSVSRTVNVIVNFAPEVVITEQVNSLEPMVRNLICTVRAYPKPYFVNLYKVGTGAYAKESDTIEDETNPLLTKETRIFTINNEKDFGEYNCVSKNSLGEVRKGHNVTMELPKPDRPQLIDFPANSVLTDEQELQWSIKSPFEIIKFEIKISKVTQATPGLSKSLLFLTDIKPKSVAGEYYGSYELNNLETANSYQIVIKAINEYDQSSEIEFDLHLQKSSSSSTNQSLICILLILIINLIHFWKY